MARSLGLYLHIPFCLSKCRYCDFCSFPRTDTETMAAYTRELCRRLEAHAPLCKDYVVDTVYLGGGTPCLLPLSEMERIFSTLRACYSLSGDAEITCECNPAATDRAYLRALRTMGVNRLSIGVQSAHENELRLLGRAHSFGDVKKLFDDARAVGFDNVSADLMYGIPDQTLESFASSIDAVCDLSPTHISSYALSIEEGTPFFAMQDRLSLPDEDTEFAMYELLERTLAARGYARYEISNFAKPDKESRHNLRYWKGEEYLGFGVAAHSDFGGARFGNSREFAAFLRGEDITAEYGVSSKEEREEEYVMLRLRLAEGIDLDAYQKRTGKSFAERYPNVPSLLRDGFLQETNGRIAFTTRGFFVSNAILSDMFAFT